MTTTPKGGLDLNSDTKAKTINHPQFVQILTEIMKERGLKKQEFAEEIGIRNTNLSRYLTGKLLQPPHFSTLEKIAGVSENPDKYFKKLLETVGYSDEDYQEYQKREEQKLAGKRKTEDEIWETCRKLVKMDEKELRALFGCPSVSSVMRKFKYYEVVQILYANCANARIGMVARKTDRNSQSPWGVATSWQDGVYQILLENGKSIAAQETEVEWHPQQINLKATGVADIAECLTKINHAE